MSDSGIERLREEDISFEEFIRAEAANNVKFKPDVESRPLPYLEIAELSRELAEVSGWSPDEAKAAEIEAREKANAEIQAENKRLEARKLRTGKMMQKIDRWNTSAPVLCVFCRGILVKLQADLSEITPSNLVEEKDGEAHQQQRIINLNYSITEAVVYLQDQAQLRKSIKINRAVLDQALDDPDR